MLLSSHPHSRYLGIYNLPWQKIALLAIYVRDSYSSEEAGPSFSEATFHLPVGVPGTQSVPQLGRLTWDIDSWGAGLRQQEWGRLIPFVDFFLSFYAIQTIFTFFNPFSG